MFEAFKGAKLTDPNERTRLDRCRQLLRQYPPHMVDFLWFTDEKVFTVETPRNTQNDRVYVAQMTRKKEVAADRLLRQRSTFSKSVMVSVGVSSLGCTAMHFIDPGV
jgi:hypothetical protein